MNVNSIFQVNNLKIKNFLIILFSLLVALWTSIFLETIGIKIPILRELVGLILIIYFLGALVLRMLKIHENDNIKNFLYCIGLSISTIMLIGFSVSYVYPLIGIDKPLSLIPLLITITGIIILFSVISYIRDNNFHPVQKETIQIDKKTILLILVPFVSIFGSYLITFYNIHLVTIILIFLIGFIILLAAFEIIPVKLFPLTIFIISISLLFHNSLISTYVSGFDVQRELYVTNLVISNFKWDPFIQAGTGFFETSNSLLSITVLPAIISSITKISVVWIYKVIFPLIFSFVPLGLYSIFKDQIDEKTSFLAVIFFISIYAYFFNMLHLMRELIGELFLVLIIILLLEKTIKNIPKSFLLVIFILSFITSHYGLAYLFLASLLFVTIFIYFIDRKNPKYDNKVLTANILLLYIVLILVWYIYTSNSSVFISIVNIFQNVFGTITSEFLDPRSSQGLGIIVKQNYFLNNLNKYLHILTQIFITIGLIYLILNKGLLKYNKIKIKKEFLLFAIISFILCVDSILLPNFAVALDTIRIYQYTLIFLAPIGVIGGILVLNILTRDHNKSIKLLSIFFVVFLFFNTGLVNEIFKVHYEPTIAFNNINDPPSFTEAEIDSARWITMFKNDSMIYSDRNGYVLLNGFVGDKSNQLFYNLELKRFNHLDPGYYIYLREKNVKGSLIVPMSDSRSFVKEDYISLNKLELENKNKIYDGNSVIYLT